MEISSPVLNERIPSTGKLAVENSRSGAPPLLDDGSKGRRVTEQKGGAKKEKKGKERRHCVHLAGTARHCAT